MIRRYLYGQFRRPRGPLGMLVGRIMSKRSSNRQRSRWTVGLLDLEPTDRVLELGYGPGLGLEAALETVSSGEVVGVDHSETMRRMAARRNGAAIRAGRLRVLLGDARELPTDLGRFDRIFSANVWLFWSDPVAVLVALRRSLTDGGRIAVTHLPRHGGATRDDAIAAATSISEQLRAAGYVDIVVEELPLEPVPAVCALARNPAAAG
jgi:SAM-dependent methyltransferase